MHLIFICTSFAYSWIRDNKEQKADGNFEITRELLLVVIESGRSNQAQLECF